MFTKESTRRYELESLDQAQDIIDNTSDVIGFRAYTTSAKRKKKLKE